MLAAGLFHIDCAVTLRRLYCLVVLEAGSRSVPIPGVTAHPDGRAARQIRDLLMDLGHWAADFRFLVRGRAGQFTESSGAVLAGAGIEAMQIPPRSPRANADAERFVRTARTEVTDPMLISGERHLRPVPARSEAHHNGRDPNAPANSAHPGPATPPPAAPRSRFKRRTVPGDLLNEYERAAQKPRSSLVAEFWTLTGPGTTPLSRRSRAHRAQMTDWSNVARVVIAVALPTF
jgi:hypothetical protein